MLDNKVYIRDPRLVQLAQAMDAIARRGLRASRVLQVLDAKAQRAIARKDRFAAFVENLKAAWNIAHANFWAAVEQEVLHEEPFSSWQVVREESNEALVVLERRPPKPDPDEIIAAMVYGDNRRRLPTSKAPAREGEKGEAPPPSYGHYL